MGNKQFALSCSCDGDGISFGTKWFKIAVFGSTFVKDFQPFIRGHLWLWNRTRKSWNRTPIILCQKVTQTLIAPQKTLLIEGYITCNDICLGFLCTPSHPKFISTSNIALHPAMANSTWKNDSYRKKKTARSLWTIRRKFAADPSEPKIWQRA